MTGILAGKLVVVTPDPADLPLVPAHALRDLRPTAPGLAGMWRYRDCIPVSEVAAARVTLSEGLTPLVAVDPRLAGVMAKLDFLLPTGSFKDRGAAVLIASALERGASSVIADSSGNAGSAIAAYAARAGLGCTVYVPDVDVGGQASADPRLRGAARARRRGPHGHGRGGDRRRRAHRSDVRLARLRPVLPGRDQDDSPTRSGSRPVTRPTR